jgi:nucleoside-diphosphate kinase
MCQGIIPNYAGHLAHACSGPSIALMLAKGASLHDREEHVAQLFREACGPVSATDTAVDLRCAQTYTTCDAQFDSEVARVLRPQSVRAQFSQDRLRNAVHCTDIPEDGALECSYFFDVLGAL